MPKSSPFRSLLAAIALSVPLSACTPSVGATGGENGQAADEESQDGEGTQDGSGDGTGDGTGNQGGSGSNSGDGEPATAETCDGLDNDKNGVIDDLDVGGDGVCDCLRIATVGFRGQWGSGDVFNNWLNGKSTNGAVALEAQTLTPELLSGFQVIVVQDVRANSGAPGVGQGIGRPFAASEIEALDGWVSAGGGVMTLIGYGSASESNNVNTLLAPYGMAYVQTPVLSGGSGGTAAITGWMAHPLTDAISQVGVDNGYPVSGGELRIAWQADAQSVTHDMGRATSHGQGHVFVWGDEWITYDSEWTGRPDYQLERFWLNAIKWLTPANECQVAIPTIG